MLWSTLKSNEVMADLSTTIPPFHHIHICLLLNHVKIYKSIQDIVQIKKGIKVISTKSERHRVRLTKIKVLKEAGVQALVETFETVCPSVNIVI